MSDYPEKICISCNKKYRGFGIWCKVCLKNNYRIMGRK